MNKDIKQVIKCALILSSLDKLTGLARKSDFIILKDSSISHLPLTILNISKISPIKLVVNA